MKQLIAIACIVALFIGCKRKGEPFPRICTESKDAIGGMVTMKSTDTLVLVNCSERFSSQRWVMPGGGTSTEATVYFIPAGVGTYDVRLYVSDNDFVNEYEAVKQVTVIP